MIKRAIKIFLIVLILFAVSCGNNDSLKNEPTSIEEKNEEVSTTVSNENTNEGEKFEFMRNNQGERPNGGMGAGANFLDETAKENLKKVSNEVKDKFKEFVYTDETGLSVNYGLFIPESYGVDNKSYPLIMFVGDATTTGNTITQILENCIGSVIWATNEEQKKHECFVLVPTFDEALIDDSNGNHTISKYMDVIVRMIKKIESDYNIDTNKVYSTGQSMGCMTSLYLTANNKDLFTATLLVDGQWDINQIQGIKDRKFIYFAAEGDKKAYEGQTDVKNYLKENNTQYAEVYDVDAKADKDSLNKIADDLFSKGCDKNFITWKLNSTYVNGESNGSMAGEHMTSFYYGYNIERVRDWLFEQSSNVIAEGDDMVEVSNDLKFLIDDVEVDVEWENNESVYKIAELLKGGPVTINTHQYGGFEQVGEIGQNIVSDDVQMTTEPGDIVLYNGDNIVVFYGSNSWSYTKLGKIVGKTNEELNGLLNKSGVLLKITNQ